MDFSDVEQAVADARDSLRAVDRQVGAMTVLCAGRLRAAFNTGWVHQESLRALKKELRDYNPHTDKWRDR